MAAISVIVPVYGVKQYLAKCLESIINQTFCDFEIILVDDGSTDGSAAICDTYAEKDNRITVIHKENGGVSKARNTGLAVAKGEFVTFCDADDYYEPMWLEKLYENARNSGADFTVGNFREVDENGNELSVWNIGDEKKDIADKDRKLQYTVSEVIYNGKGWNIWQSLFKNDILQTHSVRFCETCGNFAEDLGFVLQYLLYCGLVQTFSFAGYNYVHRGGSMMAKSEAVYKFDCFNEVAKHFGNRFLREYEGIDKKKIYALLYFFIMSGGYNKCIYRDSALFPKELKKIQDKKWNRKWTKQFIFCKKRIEQFVPGDKDLPMIAHYAAHRNAKLFMLESLLYYRKIGKKNEKLC